jgi:hypothetical protein
LGRFWVVHVDTGETAIEVYQSPDDPLLDEPSAWMRLKQFCEDTGAKLINMAWASNPIDPNRQIDFDPLADAYFYARRTRKLMTPNPFLAGYQDDAHGVGQLHGDTLKIIWELGTGEFDLEERKLSDYPSPPVSLIFKD